MSFKYYNLYNSVHKVSDLRWLDQNRKPLRPEPTALPALPTLPRTSYNFSANCFFSIRWTAPGRWKTKISTSFPQGLILYSPSNILMTVKEKSVHGGGSREKVCLGLLGLCVWDRIDVICVILKAWIVDEKTFAGKTKIKLCFHYIFSLSLSFHTIK